jgi:hypothetical protein
LSGACNLGQERWVNKLTEPAHMPGLLQRGKSQPHISCDLARLVFQAARS